MTERQKIGYIHIDYTIAPDGDLQTRLDFEGDIPLVTQLGLIELAKDSLLNPPESDEEEYDGL